MTKRMKVWVRIWDDGRIFWLGERTDIYKTRKTSNVWGDNVRKATLSWEE